MIGLMADVEDGLDWANLSADNARKAALHSLYDLNGVPPWLDRLTETHPAIVRAVYREQLEWEFRLPVETQHASGLLHDLAYGDRYLQELCLEDIQSLLSQGDPLHFDVLKYALRILVARNSVEYLASVAPDRTRAAASETRRRPFALWLSVWLQVDCVAAMDYLDQYLSENPDTAYDVVLEICAALYSDFSQQPQVINPSYLAMQNLPRFLRLLYQFVDPREDQWHEGVHSPDARDHAQHFRSNVLKHLIEAPPEINAYSSMVDFAATLEDGEEKEILLQRASERARIEADRKWEETAFVEFSKRYEVLPRTSDELYAVGLDRLDDIKDGLENGDFSPRNDLRADDHEHKIQREIAKLLDTTRCGAYEVVREIEVADDKEIDIRLIQASLTPTTIEVKWAHKWSFNQHLTAIRDQLLGQYMRGYRSQHGVYLIVNMDPGHQWRPDGESMIELPELTVRLQAFADTLMNERGGGEKITVVAIELSPGC
jgi:hypothetical protein